MRSDDIMNQNNLKNLESVSRITGVNLSFHQEISLYQVYLLFFTKEVIE